jgi:hypothetical protein
MITCVVFPNDHTGNSDGESIAKNRAQKIKAAPSGEGRRGDGRSVARWTYPERLRREAHFVQCNVIVCI